MIDKAVKALVIEAGRIMDHRLDGVRHEAARATEEVEKFKSLVAQLVNLSAEVREGDFFAKVQVLKIGELVIMGEPQTLGDPCLQFGTRGGVPLHGYPTGDDKLPPGRYRVVLTMQKVGDL